MRTPRALLHRRPALACCGIRAALLFTAWTLLHCGEGTIGDPSSPPSPSGSERPGGGPSRPSTPDVPMPEPPPTPMPEPPPTPMPEPPPTPMPEPPPAPEPPPTPQPESPFVQVVVTNGVPGFALAGRPFRFVGSNAYYLQEEAARELAGRGSVGATDEALTKMARLGITVVRAWAFNDDPTKDTVIQRSPLVYDEANLRGLDTVIAKAGAAGVKLILPLANYWNAYGGARQYVAWHGHANPVEGDARFFTDRRIRDHFLSHIERILTRVNTVNGLEYRNDPAILGWELMNEMRGAGIGDDGTVLRGWVDEVAGRIQQLDTNHLVTTGEEGFESSYQGYDQNFWSTVGDWAFRESASFTKNTSSPAIDFATVHLYPEQWGWPEARIEEAGARWVADHTRIAHALGKPMVLGEFGLENQEAVGKGAFDLDTRRRIYSTWMDAGLTTGSSGVLGWLFAYDARPDNWDDHTFYWKNGTSPSDRTNRYADLFQSFAARFRP